MPATDRVINAGEALLRRFKRLGIDYAFVNSGTDFPPIIEGLAQSGGADLPDLIVAPHEHAAMSMAHGYYLATGKPQAVMVHTNVGLANASIGAINAACDHIPVILCSGRTPVTETGRFGGRMNPINWGQEMRDQAALVREATKWDFELRFPEQVADLADRAYAIATSLPRGPVYLSLPREVLSEPCPAEVLTRPPALASVIPAPRPADVDAAAEILARAERPLIIGQRGAGGTAGFATLARLCERWAFPVVEYWPTQVTLSTEHPMQAGYDPSARLAEADAVLVIDALTPWAPFEHAPPAHCPVIQIGQNPLFSRTPVRGFRADIALPGETSTILAMLEAALTPHHTDRADAIAQRHAQISKDHDSGRGARDEQANAGSGAPMTKAWAARYVAEVAERTEATVVSELGCPLPFMTMTRAGSYFQEPHSGGLGWGVGAALGYQLADRDRPVIATIGDGSYMFANPVACHQIAEAAGLPILTVVLNNASWNAVKLATKAVYPDGAAAKSNAMPLTALAPSPAFTKVAEASRAYAERVENGDDLPAALDRALEVVRTERRQALLDVNVAAD